MTDMLARLIIIIAVIAFFARAAYGADATENCGGNGNTQTMVECAQARTAEWDERMNVAYQQALKDASSSRQRDQLRAAQRLWVQYRDANCLYYGLGEGTIARVDAAGCMLSLTETRARELEHGSHQ
jgi:uncharacterized protein YecT (DUF1311 family)